ncbi:MAG: hypothetical protein ACJAZH_000436 [Roseivirga sp.]|jgi:hypothetical protein
MRNFTSKFLAVLVLAATFTACEEDGDLEGNAALQTKVAELYLQAEGRTNQIFSTIDEGFKNQDYIDNGTAVLSNGATFSNDPTSSAVNIDFGMGIDVGGDLIAGAISLDQQGTIYADNNAIVVAQLVGYTVDASPVLGKITVENKTIAGGSESREITVEDFTIQEELAADSINIFKLNTATKLDWTAGSSTPSDITDDQYEVMGNSSNLPAFANDITGVLSPAGVAYDVSIAITITEKLVVANSCDYRIVSGLSTLSFGTTSTVEADAPFLTGGTLDFDKDNTGLCDQFARLEADTKTGGSAGYTLTLQKVN